MLAIRLLGRFLAIGALLFVAQSVLSAWLARPERERIVIDSARIERVREQLALSLRGEPTESQLRAAIEAEIDDEILFREGLALGLPAGDGALRQRLVANARFLGFGSEDEETLLREALALGLERTDPVVRRGVVLRMRSLLERPPSDDDPPADEIRAHYEANASRYVEPARVRLSHVYVSRSDADAEERARALRARLVEPEASVDDAIALGDPFLRGHHQALRTQREVAGIFGAAFAQRVFGLAAGEWSEPVESAYGLHLVFVHERAAERPRPLEEVRARVVAEIRARQGEDALRHALARLRTHYDVDVALAGAGGAG